MKNPHTNPKPRPYTIRPLTRDDLARLAIPRQPIATPKKLRDSHHRVARMVAAGLRPYQVAAKSGYSSSRLTTLCGSPAFQELVAHYRDIVDASYVESMDDYHDLALTNMLKAERQISDRLDEADEADELLPTRDLIAISRDAADRFGYGKKQTNINVNADFAEQLERAIKRSGKTIEGTTETVTPFRRRA